MISLRLKSLKKERIPKKIRLNKFLRDAGIASRRQCDELIRQGRVAVNGVATTKLATLVDHAADRIQLDGKTLDLGSGRCYILLNKPAGCLVSRSDPQGRPLVTGLLPAGLPLLFPVGRLDYHTAGALLLTNDGELANRLIHPRYHVVKTYQCWVTGTPSPAALAALERGMVLDGKKTLPARAQKLRTDRKTGCSLLEIQLREGRNRQVRRMCARVGHPVKHLVRTDFAGLKIRGLAPGAWRHLTAPEISRLRNREN